MLSDGLYDGDDSAIRVKASSRRLKAASTSPDSHRTGGHLKASRDWSEPLLEMFRPICNASVISKMTVTKMRASRGELDFLFHFHFQALEDFEKFSRDAGLSRGWHVEIRQLSTI